MENSVVTETDQLDEEWVELILLALKAGMDPKEIKDFFRSQKNYT